MARYAPYILLFAVVLLVVDAGLGASVSSEEVTPDASSLSVSSPEEASLESPDNEEERQDCRRPYCWRNGRCVYCGGGGGGGGCRYPYCYRNGRCVYCGGGGSSSGGGGGGGGSSGGGGGGGSGGGGGGGGRK